MNQLSDDVLLAQFYSAIITGELANPVLSDGGQYWQFDPKGDMEWARRCLDAWHEYVNGRKDEH